MCGFNRGRRLQLGGKRLNHQPVGLSTIHSYRTRLPIEGRSPSLLQKLHITGTFGDHKMVRVILSADS